MTIDDTVVREGLLRRALSGRVIAIEAPSGAGKSTLLEQLADRHDGPVLQVRLTEGAGGSQARFLGQVRASLRHLGLSDLVAAVGPDDDLDLLAILPQWSTRQGEQLVLQVDDLQRADADLVDALGELADRWPPPHRLVLAGRRIPTELRRVLLEADSVELSADELRFSPQELRELLGPALAAAIPAADIELIAERGAGWAAAMRLAVDRLRRAQERDEVARVAAELVSRPVTVHDLLRHLLERAPRRLVTAVGPLTALPLLDDHLARVAGIDGGIAELVDLGLPLDDRGDGWWTVPDVVRDALAPDVPAEELARVAARHYVEVGEVTAGLEVLLATSLQEDVAKILVDLPPAMLARMEVADLESAVAALPGGLLATHPRILVLLADAYTLAGRKDANAETLQRTQRLLADQRDRDAEPDSETLDVRAAVLAHRVAVGGDGPLLDEVEGLLAHPALPPMGRARLTVALGRATARERTVPALEAAARRFGQGARAFQQARAPIHAIAVHVIAVTDALLPLGQAEAAIDLLDQVPAVARTSVALRVAILPYRTFALIDLGRYAEAAGHLRELRQMAAATGGGNQRAGVYGRWAAARMASQRGEREETWAACHAVERADVVLESPAESFLVDAAQLLARVGALDEAYRMLAQARERAQVGRPALEVAAFVIAAYAGDRAAAEAALAHLQGGRLADPRDRWRLTLLHAHLCHRDGDPAAATLAAAAFEEAAQLGNPRSPLIQEPRVAEELLAAATSGSNSARDVAATHGGRLRVLGGIDVEVGGHRTEPVGRQAQLLALLALGEGQRSVDQLVDALWPGDDPRLGRDRLRTVIRRVRREHGDVVERHGDLVRLRSTVTVDVDDLLAFCRAALEPPADSAPSAPDRAAAAAAALELYRGEPAPQFADLAEVEIARRYLEERVLAMHDVLAEVATAEDRLDEAIRVLLAALRLDPVAEPRYLAAARLLAEQGRRARALRLLEEAREAFAAAGLAPTPELERFAAYLARGPAAT
ncbi:MAG: BTAD domain-containing putative transcriptional regulator [Nitriliruptoraceae bacterium]